MLSVAIGIVFLVAVVVLLITAVHRLGRRLTDYTDFGDPRGDDDTLIGVREPRRPPPTSDAAAAAVDPDEYAA